MWKVSPLPFLRWQGRNAPHLLSEGHALFQVVLNYQPELYDILSAQG